MTESDWMTSRDPSAMLTWLSFRDEPVAQRVEREPRVSDRKLRLFAEAVRDASLSACQNDARRLGRTGFVRASEWARIHVADIPQKCKADILRDIVGSPRRTSLAVRWGRVHEHAEGRAPRVPLWLTPQVLGIAKAAYEERLPDGTLDNARLAVLSDALEEAGCAEEVECDHCASRRNRPKPRPAAGGQMVTVFCKCDGSGRIPHPILAHLRSIGPHYRGMWSLDLILGEK